MSKPKIRIEMSGCVIQYITASTDMDIDVVDYDKEEASLGESNDNGYRNIYSPDKIDSDLKFLEKKEE